MCESNFNAPAHLEIAPRPLRFSNVTAGWLRKAFTELSVIGVEKAGYLAVPVETGYYRLKTADGRLLFAKVKTGKQAAKEAKAAALSSSLYQLGAASLKLNRSTFLRDEDLSIFVYPWLEQAFFDGSLDGTKSLGKSLALLHMRMRDLPKDTEKKRHLFEVWEDRLMLIPNVSFASDYRSLLTAAGEAFARSTNQMAHNDIHRGNVIYEGSKVAAFIDFEDAVDTISSPLVDISASLERFCLLPELSDEKVRGFLSSYVKASGSFLTATATDIVTVGLCRCYNAIAILELSRAPENQVWQAERHKFNILLEKWHRWEQTIALAIRSIQV
ncbi:MAG: hypothetical protein COB78_13250 [Hyphomicrobiales bacterium]|nr:MAG: hypothetical protein COB78_13250 [Hyphomicrobiales bacterium]